MNHTPDVQILTADTSDERHLHAIKVLVKEYFSWGNSEAIRLYGFNFDIDGMYNKFIEELPVYQYPDGMLYLIACDDKYIGVGGFKRLSNTICELKRMFIQQKYRGRKFGKMLLNVIIRKAREYGYEEMRLESARFMTNAACMYRKNGFQEIAVYAEAESPEEYHSIIYCMNRKLLQ